MKQYLPEAKAGNPADQLMVGELLIYPISVGGCQWEPKEDKSRTKEGIGWYLKAANQGFTTAMIELGDIYADAHLPFLHQDFTLSSQWYKKAADLNDSRGQYKYAMFLLEGVGTQQANDSAVQLLRLSSFNGNINAQNKLAEFYYEGDNVIQDKERALKLWKIAARHCSVSAADNLIRIKEIPLTEEGKVIIRPYLSEFYRDNSPALAGCSSAQSDIAGCYEEKNRCADISPNEDKAREWRLRAAESGDWVRQKDLFEQFLKPDSKDKESDNKISACYFGTLIEVTNPIAFKPDKYSLYRKKEDEKYWNGLRNDSKERLATLKATMNPDELKACSDKIDAWSQLHPEVSEDELRSLVF
ncbi:MAG: sel1 repeat family protein [Alphaproteobacteria bacterium]|nr:sel1 repeat family protein [Alphaproteobacteria bacterium]